MYEKFNKIWKKLSNIGNIKVIKLTGNIIIETIGTNSKLLSIDNELILK